MSATAPPCLWRDAGQAGQEVLAAIAAHLPQGVALSACVLADQGRVLDVDGAMWWLEADGAHRMVQTSHGAMEETIWARGRETSRRVYLEPPA